MPTEPRYLPSPAGTGSESTADACSCKSHAHLHCEAQQRRRCRGCCDKRHQGKCEAPCDAARCTAGRVHPALAWVIPTARTHGVQALATGSRHNDAISPSAWHPACWLPKVLGTSSPQAPRAGRICATNRMEGVCARQREGGPQHGGVCAQQRSYAELKADKADVATGNTARYRPATHSGTAPVVAPALASPARALFPSKGTETLGLHPRALQLSLTC